MGLNNEVRRSSGSGLPANVAPAFQQIERTATLVFDDGPVDAALHGGPEASGTLTNIYATASQLIAQLADAAPETADARLARLCDLVIQHADISSDDYRHIRPLLQSIVLQLRSAVQKTCDPYQVRLLTSYFALARRHRDRDAQLLVGQVLYRTWQNAGKFEEARGVVKELIAISRLVGNRKQTGIFLNEYAFQYWLAKDFEPAAAGFLESAHEFETIPDSIEHANALANYWAAVFESSRMARVSEMEPAFRRTARILKESNDWRERKSLVYLAKIHEARGEFAAALPLVTRAVGIDEAANTPYGDVDREFLQRLQEECARPTPEAANE